MLILFYLAYANYIYLINPINPAYQSNLSILFVRSILSYQCIYIYTYIYTMYMYIYIYELFCEGERDNTVVIYAEHMYILARDAVMAQDPLRGQNNALCRCMV